MEYILQIEDFTVQVIRKRIRTIRLQVTAEGQVICSAPVLCPESKITAFIQEKALWIKKSLVKVKNASQNQLTLRPDGQAFLSGLTENHRKKNGRNFIYSAEWKNKAFENFEHTVCRFLPEFDAGLLPQIKLKGRSMHSMWGNCNRKTQTVTLNWELFNFPQDCIDYVVLHELTHFLYIYHDRNFYSYIQKIMPDYKNRVKLLKGTL